MSGCYLYLICEGNAGPVKVGISSSPNARLYGLQSGNPRKLSLVYKWLLAKRKHAEMIETDLHDILAKHSMVGEWFDLTATEALSRVWQRLEEKYGFHNETNP